MNFATHWAWLLLLAIPLLLYVQYRRRRRGSLRFSSTGHAAHAGRSWRQRILLTPTILRILALILLVAALARPQKGKEQIHIVSKGVAIEMVVDRSGSMGAEMDYAGDKQKRLEVVKKVFAEFVQGNGEELEGRPNDLIGMITFARYADTVCPLTLAHGALNLFLEKVKLVERRSEDGTAIGDALALAAARLKTAEETLAQQTKEDKDKYKIKSKVIILLTDGQNNAGKRLPLEAAKLAKEWGIKIYAIGVGGQEGIFTIQTPFGERKVAMGSGVDMHTLQDVAQATGEESWLAEDAESLRKIYEQIDHQEKSEIESVRYLDYRELFVPFALAALGLLALESLLSCTVFRRIP